MLMMNVLRESSLSGIRMSRPSFAAKRHQIPSAGEDGADAPLTATTHFFRRILASGFVTTLLDMRA